MAVLSKEAVNSKDASGDSSAEQSGEEGDNLAGLGTNYMKIAPTWAAAAWQRSNPHAGQIARNSGARWRMKSNLVEMHLREKIKKCRRVAMAALKAMKTNVDDECEMQK